MRNLIGRLNARTPDELAYMAEVWRVPLSGRDKLARVAALYRAMTTHWVARELWDRFEDEECALLRLLLAQDEEGAPLRDLATELGTDVAGLRPTATTLYRAGIIARDGVPETLPIGEEPRLFIPREIANELERARDERARGDVSDRPLRELLALRDDLELEEAAERWGVQFVAGATARETLTRQLLAATGDLRRRDRVIEGLPRVARELWEQIRVLDSSLPTTVEAAARLAGVNGDDLAAWHRFRTTLADLEEALVLLPTITGDDWAVFIPLEVLFGAGATTAPGALTPVPAEAVTVPWRHEHAVAWDLLTLLQWLTGPRAEPGLDPFALGPRALGELNRLLWIHGEQAPPPGYVPSLITLASALELIDEPEEDGGALRRTEELRGWRRQPFPAQSAALRSRWLRHGDWFENEHRDDIEVLGGDWSALRLKLLTHLAMLEAGAWYPVEEVARSIAARDPQMLGSSAQVATAWATPSEAGSRGGLEAVVTATLETGFCWFGLVEIASPPREARLLRLTPLGRGLAKAEPAPSGELVRGGTMSITPDGEIALTDPAPITVWSVLAFAEPLELDRTARYQLTEASVGAALGAGFELGQITGFLERGSGSPLPEKLARRMERWQHGAHRVRLSHALLLAADDAESRETTKLLLERDGYRVSDHGGRLLVEIGRDREPLADDKRIEALLRAANMTVTRRESSQ